MRGSLLSGQLQFCAVPAATQPAVACCDDHRTGVACHASANSLSEGQ